MRQPHCNKTYMKFPKEKDNASKIASSLSSNLIIFLKFIRDLIEHVSSNSE